jgi:hypothetical protein
MKLSQSKLKTLKRGRSIITKLSFVALLMALVTFSVPSLACRIGLWPDKVSTGPRSYVLDVYAANFSFGASIDSSYINYTPAQDWTYTLNTTQSQRFPGFSVFTMAPTSHQNLCMADVGSGSVILEYCNGQMNQLWFYEGGPQTVNGIQTELVSYTSYLTWGINSPSKRCLDINGDRDTSGTLIDTAPCNGTFAQLVYLPDLCSSSEPPLIVNN